MIDLHVHTTASDGRESPEQVISRAAERGVTHLVLTDHSVVTFDGLTEPARRQGVELPFPGVEVSTFHNGRRYHILAYGPGVLSRAFRTYLSFPNRRKNAVATAVREVLADLGFALPPIEAIRAGAVPGAVATPEKAYPSRTAIARCVTTVADMPLERAYELVTRVHTEIEGRDEDDPARLARRYLPTLDVLAAAGRVGATTAVAHPVWECRNTADIDRVIADLRTFLDADLKGIETRSYHHRHLDDHPSILRARAELKLLSAGGSDYHANGKTQLGSGGIQPEDFEALRAVVRTRVPVDADLSDLESRLPRAEMGCMRRA
jgi:hypothetical protein